MHPLLGSLYDRHCLSGQIEQLTVTAVKRASTAILGARNLGQNNFANG
jgi:hypothetical protein